MQETRPEATRWSRAFRAGVPLVLLLSALSLGLAPRAMPDGYSWILHSTSESAAQGLTGAWVARLGFVLFGLGVLWLVASPVRAWGTWASLVHGCFGVMMLGTAAFSHRPWLPDIPFDPIEDLLHSATATGMGFAFAVGVVLVALKRSDGEVSNRSFDAAAVVASVVLPLIMSMGTPYMGVLQRSMFLVAYLWYGREARRGGL